MIRTMCMLIIRTQTSQDVYKRQSLRGLHPADLHHLPVLFDSVDQTMPRESLHRHPSPQNIAQPPHPVPDKSRSSGQVHHAQAVGINSEVSIFALTHCEYIPDKRCREGDANVIRGSCCRQQSATSVFTSNPFGQQLFPRFQAFVPSSSKMNCE